MKIDTIKLENIRSFTDNEIKFPDGSILLSGDIGSGKSSILLAVEFALFGLMRTELSGNELLRNGTNYGSVTLNFDVGNKKVEIKRTLRGGKSVNQDSGYIKINGRKEELTPNELKQRVLELLNYPKELLTKSKSLIYRYTVYTPQEEMKKILLEPSETRLDTLRKVFGIDKYKRITDNTKILTIYLRETRKILEGKAEGLDKLKDEQRELKIRQREFLDIIKVQDAEIKNCRLKLNEKKIQLMDAEKSRVLRADIEILERDLKNKTARHKENNENVKTLESEILNLEKEIKKTGETDYNKHIEEIRKVISGIRDSMLNKNNRESYLKAKRETSSMTKKEISELDICPVCKQKVDENHKHGIINAEDMNIAGYDNEIMKLVSEKKELNYNFEMESKKLEEFLSKQREYEISRIKSDSLREKILRKKDINRYNENLEKEIKEINNKKQELYTEIEKLKAQDYGELREEFERVADELRYLEVGKAETDANLKNIEKNLSRILGEIEEKEKTIVEIERISGLNNWVDKSFLNIMEIVERKIMLKVYHDFNSLFQKWFNILVDTENLEIKLDEEFSPKIMQNGYDMDYTYLSGGEKTAAALAYRLSLNQVINNLIVNINTNDLIILDEPTDGFSEQQIERMRLVLDELNISQIVIVSHEAKIESFVDNVIRLKKENHVSKLV